MKRRLPFRLAAIAAALSILLLSNFCRAQGGVSSASFSAAQARQGGIGPSGIYKMPTPERFRVEEFINYHRHDLPSPPVGQRVNLDLQQMRLEGRTVFQVGISTPRAIDCQKMPPLNVVLVVDRSGSMSGDRIAKVRESLRSFAEQLREDDTLSIVGFGNEAKVDLAAGSKTKLNKVFKAIDSLEADYGGTNLHAGLMLGYQTALEHYDPKRTNRVIFLTDGNANVGITESEEIAQRSAACNAKGISLVTIGLGVDFNDGLLRQISDAGLGPMHYVADSSDIQKIFVDEIDSLLAPAARQVKLTMNFGDGHDEVEIFGYKVETDKQRLVLQLDDLNHGATQVVLARVPKVNKSEPTRSASNRVVLKAKLNYVDAITGEEICLEKTLIGEELKPHSSIKRNYAIALVANSLKTAARLSNEGKNQAAVRRLNKSITKANQLLPGDQHVERVTKIAASYRRNLSNTDLVNR